MLRLMVPFLYFFDTRVRSRAERVAWVLTYLVPLHLMAVAAGAADPWLALISTAIGVVAVYAAYEYGYMVNDSVTVQVESSPTLRLPAERLSQVRASLRLVLPSRVLLVTASAAAAAFVSHRMEGDARAALATVGGLGAGILVWYEVYNRVRGRASIALFHVLVAARCVGPLVVAFAAQGSPVTGLWALLLVYALPNTIEFAAKPKYGIRALAPVAAQVDRWRVAYYAVMLPVAAAATSVWPGHDGARRALLSGLLYFLAYRTLIVLGPARRWRRT